MEEIILKKHPYAKRLVLLLIILLLQTTAAFAYFGWEPTDNPVPYYHQEKGKWYYCDDRKIFMIYYQSRTYKYIFDDNNVFYGGFVTDLPIQIP